MRSKYRNRLGVNKTGGNAIRLKLTDLQPALKNLQITARGKVRSSWNQDCGAETQNSGSGSSCKHPKFFAPAPERFGPLKIKNNCILYYWLAAQSMSVEWELKFQASAPPFKKIWLRLHSPGWNQLFFEMNNVISTNAIVFVLFVRFCAN